MSQVWSGVGSASGLGRHLPEVVPAPGGRLVARGYGGRDELFRHRRPGPRAGSALSSATPQETPTVFVVDDDLSVRESLELLIGCEGWRPETFASAREFLARPRALTPSCLVLDVSLPDLSGLDLQELVADRTDMPVIFITGYGDIPTTVRAMKAGAVEFLTKPFDDEVLLGAIRQSLERSAEALGHEAETRALRDRYASLTPREREVLRLIARGYLYKEIAQRLDISPKTVEAHASAVLRKLQLSSRHELTRWASDRRLV